MTHSTSAEEVKLRAAFENARTALLSPDHADRLDKPLAFWVLPNDRRLPIAFLPRLLKDLLAVPFEDLAATPGIAVDMRRVQTNIVIFDVTGTGMTGAEFSALLKAEGVLANAVSQSEVRMVTHYDVSSPDCERAAEIVERVTSTVSKK